MPNDDDQRLKGLGHIFKLIIVLFVPNEFINVYHQLLISKYPATLASDADQLHQLQLHLYRRCIIWTSPSFGRQTCQTPKLSFRITFSGEDFLSYRSKFWTKFLAASQIFGGRNFWQQIRFWAVEIFPRRYITSNYPILIKGLMRCSFLHHQTSTNVRSAYSSSTNPCRPCAVIGSARDVFSKF